MKETCVSRKFHRLIALTCKDCGKSLTPEQAIHNNVDVDLFDQYGVYPDECWECGGRPCKGCWG